MTMSSGGKMVVEALRRAGVEKIFSLHGANIDTIFQACLDAGMPIVDTRHEMNAGHGAEGYARQARKLGVAVVTAAGGVTNTITSMANALLDRTPVLYLCGAGITQQSESNALQTGIDQVALCTPVTKWAYRVHTIELLPRLIAQAIRIATTAPMGPVMLDLPWDILLGSTDVDAIPEAEARVVRPGGVTDGDAREIVDLLKAAKRPAIIAGGDANRADATASLARLAAATGAVVFAEFEGYPALASLPADASGGLLQGLYGLKDDSPDVVLLLGIRFGLTTALGSGILIPHSGTTIQIDPDARELGRSQKVDLGIAADVPASIAALADAAETGPLVDRSDWRGVVGRHVKRRYDAVKAGIPDGGERLHPFIAADIIADHVDGDVTLAVDGAVSFCWFSEVISRTRPAGLLCQGYHNSMGLGFGLALGAQAALPEGKRVILVTGDGALGYSLAEFDTIKRNGLPVIVVVMNNQGWGATLLYQKIVAGPDRVTGTRLENGRYEDVAAAFGAGGYFVTDAAGLEAALKDALSKNEPACINVLIDLDPIPPEMKVIMGQEPF